MQEAIERLRKQDEAKAAEDAKRLAAIKQQFAEQQQVAADLAAKVRAKQQEALKADSDARLKASIRAENALLSDEEFESVYPQLRIAELMRQSQEARQQIAQRTLHAFSV